MVASLAEGDVELDVRRQRQTLALMTIENAGVLWPGRLSPGFRATRACRADLTSRAVRSPDVSFNP